MVGVFTDPEFQRLSGLIGWFIIGFTILYNLVCSCAVDYFSLWKTRWLLTRVGTLGSKVALPWIVIADVILTSLLFFLVYRGVVIIIILPITIITSDYTVLFASATDFSDFLRPFKTGQRSLFPMNLLYFTTLLTSAWVWAYVFGAYTIRAFAFIPPALRAMSRIMDLDEHPVRSLGWVVAATSSTVMWIITLL